MIYFGATLIFIWILWIWHIVLVYRREQEIHEEMRRYWLDLEEEKKKFEYPPVDFEEAQTLSEYLENEKQKEQANG